MSLVGAKLREGEEAQDIAELFQVYRSPKTEIFHVIYTGKDNTVLAHNAIVSGILDAVRLAENDADFSRLCLRIKSTGKRLGADKIHFIHNHPSGDPGQLPPIIDALRARCLWIDHNLPI